MSCHPTNVLILFTALQPLLNAQPEERFYFFDFDGLQDWTQENPTIITDSTAPQCEIIPCWESRGASSAINSISLALHHTIRIVIDVEEIDLHVWEYCYLQYKTPPTSWVNDDIIGKGSGQGPHEENNYEIILPDSNDYNGQSQLQIRFGNSGTDTQNDKCYFDNLQIFGIPYTSNPTTFPSVSPTSATTKNPTVQPSNNPTQPPMTISPTVNPTLTPTNTPTQPTSAPTLSTSNPSQSPITAAPTNDPSLAPTGNPTEPSVNPTQYPSRNPTKYPSKFPTQSPILPTQNPTESPSIPTQNPTLLPSVNPTEQSNVLPTRNPTKTPTFYPLEHWEYPTNSPSYGPTNIPLVPTLNPTVPMLLTDDGLSGTEEGAKTYGLWIVLGIGAVVLFCIMCCIGSIGDWGCCKRRGKGKDKSEHASALSTSIASTSQNNKEGLGIEMETKATVSVKRKELYRLSRVELVKMCKRENVSVNGSKGEMIDRIIEKYNCTESDDGNEESSDDA